MEDDGLFVGGLKMEDDGQMQLIPEQEPSGDGWDIRDQIYARKCSYKVTVRPKILIPEKIWNQIMALTSHLETEWGGYFKAEMDQLGNWHISELIVPKQKASGALWEPMHGEEFDFPGVVHSHVNMVAKFSGTDDEFINANHQFSIVVNKMAQIDSVVTVELPCGLHKYVQGFVEITGLIDKMQDFLNSVLNKIKDNRKKSKKEQASDDDIRELSSEQFDNKEYSNDKDGSSFYSDSEGGVL